MKKVQPILFIIALLMLSSAIATEPSPWSVLSVISREDRVSGETVVNEELARLAQDVDLVVEGEYLRVTMADALFDGRTLVAAWELENLSDDTLVYLTTEKTEDSFDWDTEGGSNGTDTYLSPGAAQNGSIDRKIYEAPEGDTMRVGIRYQVLAPAVDVEYLAYPGWQDENFTEKMAQYEKALSEYENGADKLLLVHQDGNWVYHSDHFYEELNAQYELLDDGCTYVEAMIGTGKFTLLETLDIEFDLKITHRPESFLPDDEAALAYAYEDYTMRIIRADQTPSSFEVIVEAVFADEEKAWQYRNDNSFSFIALNAKGEFDWSESNFGWGGNSYGVLERDGGEFVTEYIIACRELLSLPETVTICPSFSVLGSGHREGITLSLR